jgi:hypothetical protein
MIYKKVEIKVEGYQETADLYTYILDNSVESKAPGHCDLPGWRLYNDL